MGMVEEFHGAHPGDNNVSDLSPMIHNTTQRFSLMDISHANVIRQKVIENFDRPYIANAIIGGDGRNIHPAMVSVKMTSLNL